MSALAESGGGRIRGRVILVATTGMALILTVIFVACSSPEASQRTPVAGSSLTTHIPMGWHLYSDPGGYFTIGLPVGWRVIGGTVESHGEQSGPSGIAATVEVSTSFFPPDENPQAIVTQLQVAVSYTQYTDTSGHYKQGMLCEMYTQSDTTIGGVRAVTVHPLSWHEWNIATSAATYQVSYGLPSDRPRTAPGIQTPVPQATATADQQLAEAILATFAPIPATPPKC